MESHELIHVEVVYASKTEQKLIKLTVPIHSTIQEVISASGILTLFPEINLAQNKVGIFSKAKTLTDEVCDGDRVEIYRPLEINPKEARRLRAKRK